MQTNLFSILVDADACPVKNEIVTICHYYQVPVFFVASFRNLTDQYPEMNWCWVDPGRDAADLFILNRIQPEDVVITDDIGLTAGCLGKGTEVINYRGKMITNHEIEFLLASRHLSAKMRRGGRHTKGPKKLFPMDKLYFSKVFSELLSKKTGKNELTENK